MIPPYGLKLRSLQKKKETEFTRAGVRSETFFMGGAGKRASFRKDPKESPCLRGGGRALKEVQNGANDRI